MFSFAQDPLWLPRQRAALLDLERQLSGLIIGVTLPWWDWAETSDAGIPAAFASPRTSAGGSNPLYLGPVVESSGRFADPAHTTRRPGRGGLTLPRAADVDELLDIPDFRAFSQRLEDLTARVHLWVGGTMTDPERAPDDPLCWALRAGVDRLWRLWQLRHPGGGPSLELLETAIVPPGISTDWLSDTAALGYEYAVSTAAAPGPEHPVAAFVSTPLDLPRPDADGIPPRFNKAELVFTGIAQQRSHAAHVSFDGGHSLGSFHILGTGNSGTARWADRCVPCTQAVRSLLDAGRTMATVTLQSEPEGALVDFGAVRLVTYA